jgi:hypothetical protein
MTRICFTLSLLFKTVKWSDSFRLALVNANGIDKVNDHVIDEENRATYCGNASGGQRRLMGIVEK